MNVTTWFLYSNAIILFLLFVVWQHCRRFWSRIHCIGQSCGHHLWWKGNSIHWNALGLPNKQISCESVSESEFTSQAAIRCGQGIRVGKFYDRIWIGIVAASCIGAPENVWPEGRAYGHRSTTEYGIARQRLSIGIWADQTIGGHQHCCWMFNRNFAWSTFAGSYCLVMSLKVKVLIWVKPVFL